MSRGKLSLLAAGAAALVLCALAAVGLWFARADSFYKFPGVNGPAGQDHIAQAAPARIEDFEHGSVHRLAILVTDSSSAWLGLARAIKAEGIPFTVTQNAALAFRHKVVLVYPIISGRALSPDALRAIAAHVHGGGTVLGFDLAGGGLESTFGIKASTPSRAHEILHWAGSHGPVEEATTRFGRVNGEANTGSYAFAPASADVIARYEDGAAAILCQTAVGKACLMGVDLGALAQRALDGRGEEIARAYVNQYEPSLDVLVRWVKDLYVQGEPMPWLIDTVPPGHDVSIVLTHDIDFTRSVVNAAAYADVERAAGVKATYFMQTKYIRDFNDDVFFTKQTAPLLRALNVEGMEIASHSVAHSRVYKTFPVGDGREHYPDYRPFVQSRSTAEGGTVFGEARVSKYLLEQLVGARITSFRPGHLSYPFNLPEILQASGYSYSSSVTADSCLTHLPHQMTFARAGQSLSSVYEFPLTIEDEEAPRLGDRLEAANALISKIAAHHGLVVILIHPDILGHKLGFEKQVLARWRDHAWMPDLDEYGAWWRARDKADFDIVEDGKNGWSMTINAPEETGAMSITLPKAKAKSASGAGYRLSGGQLTLDKIAGAMHVSLGQ